MKLLIPELGTELKLLTPWEFELIAEGRNVELGEVFNYHLHYKNRPDYYEIWLSLSDIEKPHDVDYSTVIWPTQQELDKACKGLFGSYNDGLYNDMRHNAYRNNPEYIKSVEVIEDWKRRVETVPQEKSIPITIPTGSILKVDRIYIRKGQKNFSSISFYWKDISKKKKCRFWAKLADCNKIEFELV